MLVGRKEYAVLWAETGASDKGQALPRHRGRPTETPQKAVSSKHVQAVGKRILRTFETVKERGGLSKSV